MSTLDMVIVATIIVVFLLFGVVLAWGEYQTRNLSVPAKPREARLPPMATQPAAPTAANRERVEGSPLL